MTAIQNTKKARESRAVQAVARQVEREKRSPQAQALLLKDRPGEARKEIAKLQAELDSGPSHVLVA